MSNNLNNQPQEELKEDVFKSFLSNMQDCQKDNHEKFDKSLPSHISDMT